VAAEGRKAALLLGEVLKLADYILPSGMSARLQLLPDLLHTPSSANQHDQGLSSNVIYQIDSVNRTLLKSQGPSGSADFLGEKAVGKGPATSSPAGGRPKLPIDMDEFQFRSLLIDTQVVASSNYLKWKWELILDVIEGPLLNPKRVEDAIKGSKFLKRLMAFYRPFKYRFSEARNTKPNQRYVRTGQALMKALLKTQEGLQYLAGNKLMGQLTECLAQIDRVSLQISLSCKALTPFASMAKDDTDERHNLHIPSLCGRQGSRDADRWLLQLARCAQQ